MLSLLAGAIPTILGLVTSGIPHFVKYLEKGQEYKHEVELIRLRMEAAAQGIDQEVFLETIKGAVEEGKSLREHDSTLTDSRFVNILRASVRPVITYFFFFVFIGIKVAMALNMWWDDIPAKIIMEVIWDDYTTAIFGAIVGFWFGSRAMMHTFTGYREFKEGKN